MTIQTMYNIGDYVYVSYNQLADYKEDMLFVNSPMRLDQDFPLMAKIVAISLEAASEFNYEKKRISYSLEIVSPIFYYHTFKLEYFPTIQGFSEQDLFKSPETMEEYLISKGTGLLRRGFTINEIKNIIKENGNY